METPIVVIIAMESERCHLDTLTDAWTPIDAGIWRAHESSIAGQRVITVTCGIGMSNASAATEYAITTFAPSAIMNFGCTGAHVRELFPGDVVIATELHHNGRLRFEPNGTIVPMGIGFNVPGENGTRPLPTCDPDLIAIAQRAAQSITLPEWPAASRSAAHVEPAPKVVSGPISSGDIWLQDVNRIDDVHVRTRSLCEDMEAQAIGQIATMHGVPFLSIKDISNSELHQATDWTDTSSTLETAELGKRAAMLTVATIALLQEEEPTRPTPAAG